MKISRRMREQAALIFQIAASNPRLKHGTTSAAWWLGLIAKDEHDTPFALDRLLKMVFDDAYRNPGSKKPEEDSEGGIFMTQDWPAQCAEAEALLRTGWAP